MAATAAYSFGLGMLRPLYKPDDAPMENVSLVPGSYPRGAVIGQVSSTNVNDVQTVTLSSSTNSTMTLTNLPGGVTYVAAQDVTPAALTTALNALFGAGAFTVTGTYVAGSGGTYILTAGGPLASQPLAPMGVSAVFVGGSSPTAAIVHTTTGVGPKNSFGLYASGNSDGTQTPKGLLAYPCTVDNQGNISIFPYPFQPTVKVAPMYFGGTFALEDLTGLDANAVTKLAGLISIGAIGGVGTFSFGAS